MMRAALILLTGLLLSACAQQAPDNRHPAAWLKPGVQITLPPPGIRPAFQQQQLLLSADEQQIKLAGLSSVGIRLFSLRYDAEGIHTEQLMPLPQMPPASQVLADIMLSYWPSEVWRKQLPPGWTLQDQPLKRQLRDADNQLVTEIDYLQRGKQRQPIAIQQHAFGYLIRIQHLDAL